MAAILSRGEMSWHIDKHKPDKVKALPACSIGIEIFSLSTVSSSCICCEYPGHNEWHQGLLLIGRTLCRKISWNFEAARFGFSNRAEIWKVPRLPRCCHVSERYDHYNTQTLGFETSRFGCKMSYPLAKRCRNGKLLIINSLRPSDVYMHQ